VDEPSVIVCADDFALAPGVSRGIVELVAAGRLTATSCMSLTTWWPEHAAWLVPLRNRADIGLHLTLTDHRPLGPMARLAPLGRLPPLGQLMALAWTRRLDQGEIEAEIERQVDAFTAALGAPPDFLDGHQHVHQFPVIREAMATVLARRPDLASAWLRLTHDTPWGIVRRGVAVPKSSFLHVIAGGLSRRIEGRAANRSFRGVRQFSAVEDYADLFARFVARPTARTLVMCHPGYVDAELIGADTLTTAREAELRYLGGPEMPRALQRAGARLARFGATSG
jgi:predicted glycoside hydrolase/deacetylase ChbG (UPF0249 family)